MKKTTLKVVFFYSCSFSLIFEFSFCFFLFFFGVFLFLFYHFLDFKEPVVETFIGSDVAIDFQYSEVGIYTLCHIIEFCSRIKLQGLR